MKLHSLGFIVSMRLLNGLDHELGFTNVLIIRQWDSVAFVFFYTFLKVLEDLKYESSHFEVYHLYENIEWFGS